MLVSLFAVGSTYVTLPVTALVNETATLVPRAKFNPVKVIEPVVIVVDDKVPKVGLVSLPMNLKSQLATEQVESRSNLLFTKTI